MMSLVQLSRCAAVLKQHEGVRSRVYKDSLGIETVGVGFNLRRADARQRLHAANADYDAVFAGKTSLTAQQVDALLHADIADCLADLQTLFTSFGSMPLPAQEVLVDMRFQLGGAGLRGFTNTLKAFREQRWRDAAAGMRASLAYKQTPVRWGENAARIEALA